MKTTLFALCVVVGMVIGFAGCGGESLPPPADACAVHPGDTVGYQDCGVHGCVAGCGVLPADGGQGHLLPAGCSVEIGTSSTYAALCVNSCDECR
jgi:hypothetical protein